MDWKRFGHDFFPDIEEPGSWEEMYWWRVMDGIFAEWEAAKNDPDSDKKERKPGEEPQKRSRNRPRRKPVLPRDRKKG